MFFDRSVMSDPDDYLTPKQFDIFVKNVKPLRDLTLFYVLFYTGRRVSEVVRSLKPDHINNETNEIYWYILKKWQTICRHCRHGKKNHADHGNVCRICRCDKYQSTPVRTPRAVQTNPQVLDILKKYINFRYIPDDKYVFPISRQRTHQLINYYGKMTGLKKRFHAHMFRHSFASLAIKNDIRIDILQKWLQHSSIEMTMSYSRFSTKAEQEALEKMWKVDEK